MEAFLWTSSWKPRSSEQVPRTLTDGTLAEGEQNRTERIENGYGTVMERVQNGYRTWTGTHVERQQNAFCQAFPVRFLLICTLFLEYATETRGNKCKAVFYRYKQTGMRSLELFWPFSILAKNLGDVLARGLSIKLTRRIAIMFLRTVSMCLAWWNLQLSIMTVSPSFRRGFPNMSSSCNASAKKFRSSSPLDGPGSKLTYPAPYMLCRRLTVKVALLAYRWTSKAGWPTGEFL